MSGSNAVRTLLPLRLTRILELLVLLGYGFWTLLPNSHSWMVAWPLSAIWQLSVLLPVAWLLLAKWMTPRWRWDGLGIDAIVFLGLIWCAVSASVAEFSPQAWLNASAVFGVVAAFYALRQRLTVSGAQRLLTYQGGLTVSFAGISLLLWGWQTYLPELERWRWLRSQQIDSAFHLSDLALRNWHPIGHQNYVAGFLILNIPLLIGLALTRSGHQRWLWATGIVLAVVDLYTTGSRAGWACGGLIALASGLAWLLHTPFTRRLRLLIGGVSLVGLSLLIATNQRLWDSFIALISGQRGGELAYRIVTNIAGWQIGWSHPFFGAGPGSIPFIYQAYRPSWAGQTAEFIYQLHSTPAQLWAELGIGGLLLIVAVPCILSGIAHRWLTSPIADLTPLAWGSWWGIVGYALFSLSDYQLDIPSINGSLVIYLSVLLLQAASPPDIVAAGVTAEHTRQDSPFPIAARTKVGLGCEPRSALWARGRDTQRQSGQRNKYQRWGIAGIAATLVAFSFALLVPVYRAQAIAAEGIRQLQQNQPDAFQAAFEQAHRQVPWDPYYSLQLGWQLGELSLDPAFSPMQNVLQPSAVTALQIAVTAAPQQAFSRLNLGWLLLETNPQAATEQFAAAAQLYPAQQGVWLGLGIGLAQQNQLPLAQMALTLEAIHHPDLIPSALWRSDRLAPLREGTFQQLEAVLGTLLEQETESGITQYVHRIRGSLRWWLSDMEGARVDAQVLSRQSHLARLLADNLSSDQVLAWEDSPAKFAYLAWLDPQQRADWLRRAWLTARQDEVSANASDLTELPVQHLLESLNRSSSFDGWLKSNAPIYPIRHTRVGLGVNLRHVDALITTDFTPHFENLPLAYFFNELFGGVTYLPPLDSVLQPYETELLQKTHGFSGD